jgi:hypothetical protein
MRVAAILLAIFGIGHTLGIILAPNRGPEEEAIFSAMRSFHFDVMGSSCTHWNFYQGSIFVISVAVALIVVLIWQLSNLMRTEGRQIRPLVMSLFIADVLFAVLSWIYFFPFPAILTSLAAVCLALAVFTSDSQPATAQL